MIFVNNAAAIAESALGDYFATVELTASWRWLVTSGAGAGTPISVWLENETLRLVGHPQSGDCGEQAMADALRANRVLAGGVKFAIDPRTRALLKCADAAVVDAAQLLERLASVAQGFLESEDLSAAAARAEAHGACVSADALSGQMPELFHRASWTLTECAPDQWSLGLDDDSAPPARLHCAGDELAAEVEVVHAGAEGQCRRALERFFLAASAGLRFVFASAAESEKGKTFSLGVKLSRAAMPAEIDHALAALSVAYRACIREATFLLDEGAACCYLAVHEANQEIRQTERRTDDGEFKYGGD